MLAVSSLPVAWRRIRACIPIDTDVLHASDLRGVLLAGPAARSLNIPVVWHVHLGERSTLLNRLAGRAAASIVIPDVSTLESSPGLPNSKVQVIPNAVQHDVLGHDPIPRGGHLLVTSSRIVPQKGLDLLLDAVATLRRPFPEIRLDVYGGEQEGYEAYAEQIRLRVVELDLNQTVTLRGHRDRPYRYWSEVAVYVQASRWENYPVGVLEAMALGLPVVATNVGAMAKIVEHGRTGILVPPDDPRSLAQAIKRLLESPPEADAMGKAGRERVVREFTPSTMAYRIASVYESVARCQK
jgi:glycosyltransferase involved in cell wall biosynthesis